MAITEKQVRDRLALLITENVTEFTVSTAGSVYALAPLNLIRAVLPCVTISPTPTTYGNFEFGNRITAKTQVLRVIYWFMEFNNQTPETIDDGTIDTFESEFEDMFANRANFKSDSAGNLNGFKGGRIRSNQGLQVRPYIFGEDQRATKYIAKEYQIEVRYQRKLQ